MAPLSTIGNALHKLATRHINIASVAESPAATTEDPWLHVDTVTRSENLRIWSILCFCYGVLLAYQYSTNVQAVQVRLSGGTGSWSALLQTFGGATELVCFGSVHPLIWRRRLSSSFTDDAETWILGMLPVTRIVAALLAKCVVLTA